MLDKGSISELHSWSLEFASEFETGSHSVSQSSLELSLSLTLPGLELVVLLPLPPEAGLQVWATRTGHANI